MFLEFENSTLNGVRLLAAQNASRIRLTILRKRTAPNGVVERLLSYTGQFAPPLISQISRSGGTFLSQLFDHHPQILAHPEELRIGRKKWIWPDLSQMRTPQQVFISLRDKKFIDRSATAGRYSKGTDDALPLLFDAEAQEALFYAVPKPA